MRSPFQLSACLSVSLLAVACQGPSPTPAEPNKTGAAATAGAAGTAAEPPRAESPDKLAEAEKHFQSALELEAAGRFPEARSEVDLALAGGAGRDAKLLAAKLAILRDDLDAAARLLEPLAKDETDALVLYNLGLIAQRRGEYNNARGRYLAAIKADPSYTPARYNLAVLTFDAGVKDEAQHHARKFLELAPGDPLAPELRSRILGEGQPAGAGEAPPAGDTPPPAGAINPPPTGDPRPRGDRKPAPAEPAAPTKKELKK